MDSNSEEDRNYLCCPVCRFHGGPDLPLLTISSPDDLRMQSLVLSTKVFKHWIILNRTLKRFEAQIRKRWLKRNNAGRLAVLLNAWPQMAKTHRPEFAATRKIKVNGKKQRIDREKEKEAYLWPYINQEDLVRPVNLLLFINSRGRHLPYKFAVSDHEQTHVPGLTSDSMDVEKYRMLFYGQRSPRSYGSPVLCDEVDKIQQELAMDPAAGLQVLEIQERILRFLVKCCQSIMHDANLDQIQLIETKPAPPDLKSTIPAYTVTAMAEIAPYCSPQKLDLKRLGVLIAARCEEAEEHIWALREDPRYFAQTIREWAEHSPSKIPNRFKRQHESVGKPEFWDMVAREMIFHAYNSFILFVAMGDAITVAQEKLDGCRHKLDSSCNLPREVEMAFQSLDNISDILSDDPLNDLENGFAASPPMRHGYERRTSDFRPMFRDLKITMGRSSLAWRVQVLFGTLLSPYQQEKHGLNNTIEEIQGMLDEHSRDGDFISNWVASRFSDLALVFEVRRKLTLFQPWCTMWRSRDLVQDHVPFFVKAKTALHEILNTVRLELADPARLACPSDKRATPETVEMMKHSEKHLDHIWAIVDAHCEKITDQPLHHLLMEMFSDWNRKLFRSEARNSSEGKDCNKQTQQEEERVDDCMPVHVTDPNARYSHPSKRELLDGVWPQKIKTKTRPETAVTSRAQELRRDSAFDTKEEEEPRLGEMKIKVNKRAYKVFSTMFHVPSAREQQNNGEVAWTEFLYSMQTIGFSAEKLFGSSWQFTPDTIDVKRSIQFHEPHPRSKMWYWLAKEYGRRLNRAYGWTGETFEMQ